MKSRPHGGAAGPGHTGIQVLDTPPEHGSLYGGRSAQLFAVTQITYQCVKKHRNYAITSQCAV